MEFRSPERSRANGRKAGEEGYMLVAVVVMVALVLIALSVAAPVIAKDLRRDKELESEHRAQEYVRAIRLYYRKLHAYPPSIEALKQSNNIRFLRKEYVDPLTGRNDWRIIHLGEQKTTIKGFFGQELGGLGQSGGLGSASGMGSGMGTPIGGSTGTSSGTGTTTTPGTSSTSTINSASPLASGFLGASSTTTTGGTTGTTGSTDSSSGTGGAIVGVATASTGTSILTPNKQTTYESWEFWYDPRIEQLYQKGQTNAGIGSGTPTSQPASSFGSGLSGQPNSTTSPATTTSPGTTTSPTSTTTPQ